MRFFLKLSCACFCVGLLALNGCDSGPDVAGMVGEANKTNVQKVANSLFLHQTIAGRPPKSEEELCDFIANADERVDKSLSMMQIDKATFKDHLISERDGEPFFVRYGVAIPYGVGIPLVLETVGVEGSRQVCWSDTKVTEVTDDKEYERLKKGKIKRTAPLKNASDAASAAAKSDESK